MEFHSDHELSIISARRERSQHVPVVSHAKTQDHSVLIQIKPSKHKETLLIKFPAEIPELRNSAYPASRLSKSYRQSAAYPASRLSLGKVANSTLHHLASIL